MYTIQREPLADVKGGIDKMSPEHWDEVETIPFVLDVDWDLLFSLEKLGSLLCIGARKDGECVGYAVYIISPMSHCIGRVSAHCDSIFLHPDHRCGALGIRLVREGDRILAEEGADLIVQNVRNSSVKLAGVLDRLDYEMQGYVYTKTLGED